jgi:hypothetical protein
MLRYFCMIFCLSLLASAFAADAEEFGHSPRLDGYVQIGYDVTEEERLSAGQFALTRVRLRLDSPEEALMGYCMEIDMTENVELFTGAVVLNSIRHVSIQAGRSLLPFSREWQQADQLNFIERSLLANLTPGDKGRALGAEVHLTASPQMGLALGGYNPEGGSDLEEGTPDWLCQITVRPMAPGLNLSGTIFRSQVGRYWAGSASFCLAREEAEAVSAVEGEILFNASEAIRQSGWQLTGRYGVLQPHPVLPLTELVARYATLHALDSDEDSDQVALGINLYIENRASRHRMSFNYVWDHTHPGTARKALLQFQAGL